MKLTLTTNDGEVLGVYPIVIHKMDEIPDEYDGETIYLEEDSATPIDIQWTSTEILLRDIRILHNQGEK